MDAQSKNARALAIAVCTLIAVWGICNILRAGEALSRYLSSHIPAITMADGLRNLTDLLQGVGVPFLLAVVYIAGAVVLFRSIRDWQWDGLPAFPLYDPRIVTLIGWLMIASSAWIFLFSLFAIPSAIQFELHNSNLHRYGETLLQATAENIIGTGIAIAIGILLVRQGRAHQAQTTGAILEGPNT
ncbi:MAG: hypothetical protein P4L33_21965 [Capsulimonadaceae bacterium]|nr:hypothetical protein [Capsulimonadaceae bacterium]